MTKQDLKERLNQIDQEIEALNGERREIYKASLNAPETEKFCDDFLAKELSIPLPHLKYPIQISGIDTKSKFEYMDSVKLVKIRPCAEKYENKTYLGLALGDLPRGISVYLNKETEVLHVSTGYHNPAIFVPSLQKIIWGCESWWGYIEKEEDFKQITDKDIDAIWYVQAIKKQFGVAE